MYTPLILTNIPFSECCDSLHVYYDSPNQEYTWANIYGYFVRQEDLVNERAWYKNNGISIWWYGNGTDKWYIGPNTNKGNTSASASLRNSGSCLPNISNPKWRLFLGPKNWTDANQDVKIRCDYKPAGIDSLL